MEQARREKLAEDDILEHVEALYRGDARVRNYAVTIAASWKEYLL